MNGQTASEIKGPATWIVIGASRGIGLEFVRQLLEYHHEDDTQVIAVVRDPMNASELWQIAAGQARPARCVIEMLDVRSPQGIDAFVSRMQRLVLSGLKIEGVILNAGILQYPNRATEVSFEDFANHLHTNTIGPIIVAQKLLSITAAKPIRKIVFLSSDSGSTGNFLSYEDGFAAYSASKAALNQMLRHMAAELKRKGGVWDEVCILAIHPGEVSTDMAKIDITWDVHGTITSDESVRGMLKVIAAKDRTDSGTFWCWDGSDHPW